TFLLFALVLAALAVWGLAAARAEAAAGGDQGDGERASVADPATAATAPAAPPAFSRRIVALAAAVPLAIASLAAMPTPVVKAAEGEERLLEERETNEQYARVLQSPDGHRTMELGEGHAIHSLFQPDTLITHNYWDELLALPHLAGHAPRRVLILGNAGGTTATALRAFDPQVEVDAVDYDGQLAELGAKWFGLGGPRLRLLTGDARVVLRRATARYDAILVDAYRQPYIPFHLSTREFFTLVRERLAPGGVVVVNVGHPERDDALEKVLAATMRAAGFDHVLRDPAQAVNTQLVGRATAFDATALAAAADAEEDTARAAERASAAPATRSAIGGLTPSELVRDRRSLAGSIRATAARLAPALTGGRVYTDDTAPVELLIDGSIAKVATGG
ncbi:MAG: fused MFS/spermidine synthase, partial [Patulibacter sp.]|nr:fused MFS/spermidine synthase [Patulibacter sp.]